MAGMKTVTVLTPNGRRVSVKATLNTTVLQILEEACQKQGFQPNEYDLKHHNHILDTTSTMRFSGLPNNAQLEMAPSQKKRKDNPVTIGLVTESGERLVGDFLPVDSLWEIVSKLCPDEAKPESNPVVIYMRVEVVGYNRLKETTLKSLGITGGRAMLRIVHRSEEELRHQANVSSCLPVKPVVEEQKLRTRIPPHEGKITSGISSTKNLIGEIGSDLEKKGIGIPETDPKSKSSTFEGNTGIDQTMQISPKVSPNMKIADKFKENPMEIDVSQEACNYTKHSSGPKTVEPMQTDIKDHHDDFSASTQESEEIIFLGDRNAVAFDQSISQSVSNHELPDDFFELTMEDAKTLLRDIKKRRTEMEDAPLTTGATREFETSAKMLRHLNQYKKTVIRIQFPDRLTLQGSFTPTEKVDTVVQFVRSYLQNPQTDFYLFTAPPKTVLDEDLRLFEVDCVPSAILYFGVKDTEMKNNESYLQKDILTKLISPFAATLAACQSRDLRVERSHNFPSTSRESDNSVVRESLPSSSRKISAEPQNQSKPGNKGVPKWFKPGK